MAKVKDNVLKFQLSDKEYGRYERLVLDIQNGNFIDFEDGNSCEKCKEYYNTLWHKSNDDKMYCAKCFYNKFKDEISSENKVIAPILGKITDQNYIAFELTTGGEIVIPIELKEKIRFDKYCQY